MEKGINEKKRVSRNHARAEDRERSLKSAEVLETSLTSDEARRAVHPEPEIVLA